MSSEESLASRLRPGVTNPKSGRQSARADFQEELMRLIDPDLSENDLLSLQSRGGSKKGRLQRTLSDESLHNSKDMTDSNSPTDKAVQQRLSPRATNDLASARQRSKSTVDNRAVPMLESAAALDWSKLVNVASKAIDEPEITSRRIASSRYGELEQHSEDLPPPRPPSPQMSLALSTSPSNVSYTSGGASSHEKVVELEKRVNRLIEERDKACNKIAELESEIQDLRSDNVRLQEESQTAATQLRRFTEWFFSTIDRQ